MRNSKREEGKEARRRRIVDAARALIRETGDTGLSMRAIAARAKVSLATPYNLFGSKRGVVMAVLEDAREFQEKFSTLKDLSAVDRIFKALSITFAYHVQDPEFYHTLWTSLLDPRGGDAELRAELITPQNSLFWRGLLEEARGEGAIAEDIDMGLLQEALNGRFAAVMLNWVMGGGSVRELEPSACFGYAATLCACATDSFRPEIRRRMLTFQSELLAVQAATAAL
ncbi:MAG TPA: TetR/AcrR family transcriptional regulator [Phenylobacterium sp.]|nr:TetR/AcrR family transcriptional regulator [Phenylobacterium sp.]